MHSIRATRATRTSSAPEPLPATARRIAIVGSPGSGKSTLARRLGALLRLDVYHLDDLYWKPGAVPTPDDEWAAFHDRLIARDSWIIDGTFSSTMRQRLERADAVIYLDPSPIVCTARVVRRRLVHALRRPQRTPNHPVYLDLELLGWLLHFRRDRGGPILQLLETLSTTGVKTIVVRRRSDIESLLRRAGVR